MISDPAHLRTFRKNFRENEESRNKNAADFAPLFRNFSTAFCARHMQIGREVPGKTPLISAIMVFGVGGASGQNLRGDQPLLLEMLDAVTK